jgi:hypothetical protein
VQVTDPLDTPPGQASLTAPRPDPAACFPCPLPVYSVCVYSRGSGGRLKPCAAGSLRCVLGWPMDSLSYGRHFHFA